MEIIKEENSCKNCRFYKPYYIKNRSRLVEVVGRCGNYQFNSVRKGRAKYQLVDNCRYWESDQAVQDDRKQRICDIIRAMQERLDEMALILKDDEQH